MARGKMHVVHALVAASLLGACSSDDAGAAPSGDDASVTSDASDGALDGAQADHATVDGGDSSYPPQFPAAPTRAQALSVKLTFQGLTVTLPTYGTIPWFEPAITSLDSASRKIVYDAKHAAGDTHIVMGISWAYMNDGGYSYPVPGKDLTGDLPTYRALVVEAIENGFTPLLFLAGDGESPSGGGYNDPNGWTYGYGWLSAHLPSIVAALKEPFDLTPYCILVPGWDGVMPGWQPSELDSYLLAARALVPNGYVGLELASGAVQWGAGAGNYTSPAGQALDVILQEFPGPPTGDQVWQIAARELGPAYVRPADEPAGDDPSPPFYLMGGTARGPWYAVAFEFDEYRWVRGQVTAAEIQQERVYLGAIGYGLVD
jgi:hypothetical protein